MQSDPDLLLFTCIAEADVDGELNAQDARDNWEQIEQLARAENNQKWLNRAAGERSFSEFILGHITKGRILIATALGTAQKTGDVGGEIRYLTGVGATLYFTQQYDQALEYLTKADGLIRAHPQAGYGFVTNEYRLETLVGLKQFDEAEKLAYSIIKESTSRNKKVKQAQALMALASIQEKTNRQS